MIRKVRKTRGPFALVELPTANPHPPMYALGGFQPYYEPTEEEKAQLEKEKPANLGPNIKQKMKDLQQAKKYFDNLEKWQIEKYNRNTSLSLTINGWETLYNAVISNNVKDIYDLDDMEGGARSTIISAVRDLETFNALIARCHMIKKVLPKGGITRKLFIHENLKKVFQPI